MKKKLNANTLAFANIKNRRRQYTVMIIGIILAMVFSSSIVLFLFSSYQTLRNDNYEKYGRQDCIIHTSENSESVYEKAVEDGIFSDYGLAHIIGYAYTEDSQIDYGVSIAYLEDKAKELSNFSLIDGAYPQNENEIAIEKTVLARLGYGNAEVGDEITLFVRVQNNNDYLETLEKTYTLTGIAADKRSYIDSGYWDVELIPAAFVAAGTQTEIGGLEKLVAYACKGENFDDDNSINGVIWDYFNAGFDDSYLDEHVQYTTINAELYTRLGNAVNYLSSNSIYVFIVAAVLIFASCAAIINSFNSNIKERKKQIGMLRAVGTTKRQIINIFGREALIISLICTPVSLVISYAAVRIIVSLLSENPIMAPIWAFAVAAVISIAITMLAALVPLISAARITPVQAIRNIDANRKMNLKKIKSEKEFNVERHLAKRSITLYKGAKTAVSIMLTLVILFACYGFSYFSFGSSFSGYDFDYQLYNLEGGDEYITGNVSLSGMGEGELREISDCEYFESVTAEKHISVQFHIDEITDYFKAIDNLNETWYANLWSGNIKMTLENFYDTAFSKINENYTDTKAQLGISEFALCSLYSYNNAAIEMLGDYLTAGEINTGALSAGNEIILVAPQTATLAARIDDYGDVQSYTACDGEALYSGYSAMLSGECPYSVGDKVTITVVVYDDTESFENGGHYTRVDREVTIGAIVSPDAVHEIPGSSWFFGEFGILTTTGGMSTFCDTVKYSAVTMRVSDDVELTDDIDEKITALIDPIVEKYDASLYSQYDTLKTIEQEQKTMFAAMLSIIIVAVTVAGSIINNALTATIRDGKREIGTLRAVGASEKELVLSYIRRLLSMFAPGLIAGFAGFTLSFLIAFTVAKIKGSYFELTFSPWAAIAMCVVLFAICSLNLWSKIRKEMKNSIVDNIREL